MERLSMHRIIPGLLLLVSTATASAASNLQFGPPPKWVRPTPLPAPAASTPAATQTLLVDYQTRLTPQTVSYYAESAVRIQTPQGLSAAGTVKLAWDPDTDILTVDKVHILRGNKVIDVLGAGQTFTIARREANLDYAAIDDTLTAILEPGDLEIGDTLDVAYTLERTDPVLAGTSEAEVEISPEASIIEAHVSALWPTSDPVRWQATQWLSGFHPIHLGRMSGVDLTMRNLQPIVQPKDAPLRFLVDRRADFSSFGSWAEVAQRLAPLYGHASILSPGSPLEAEIARIRAASSDPKVRAAMALRLVQNQVRYVFLGMNEGGLIPASADQTWSRRYGDCKAKTVLLLALLRGLGIDAQPVAVNVLRGDGLDARLPMVELFDHVLVQAMIDGKTFWLDGTRMGDGNLDQLDEPFYHWGLPLLSSGAQLTKMLPPPLTDPQIEESIRIDASLGVAAPAPIHAQSGFHGMTGVLLRTRLDDLTPSQLDTAVRAFWSPQAGNVKILSVSAKYDSQSATEWLTMDGTVTMNWFAGEHDLPILNLGYKPDFKRVPGPNQNAPFALLYPFFFRTTEAIKLPENGKGFSVVGSDPDRTLAGMEYRRHASMDGGTFTATASTRSVLPEFPASEAAADQKSLLELTDTQVGLRAPVGHVPTQAEIAWGLPKSNGDAADYVRSGNMLTNRREYGAAIDDFDAALALDSRNALALADRGISNFWAQNYDRAKSDFDAALTIDPHSWVAYNGRGLLALMVGDSPGAIAALSAAIADNPQDKFAFWHRAAAYWNLGKERLALADYSEAIRQDPSAIGLYWWRAVLLKEEGKTSEAIHQAKLVTTANPKSPAAYLTAGEIYLSDHEGSQASTAFAKAVSVAPVAQTYLMRAGYRPWTDLAGKRADIESALKLNPASVPALAELADVQSAMGQYEQAIATLNRAMNREHDQNDRRLLALRGIAYQKSGQTAAAQSDLAKAQEKVADPEELNDLCWRLATAGVSLESALADCNAAVDKRPRVAAFQDSLGFVLLRLQRYRAAVSAYDAALKLSPLEIHSLYGRGICELRSGNERRAHADIKAATALSFSVADEFAHYGVRP
jgi:tetratricopeptide (TPR) repeat protein/transglutaminase-like putative cysteine protease